MFIAVDVSAISNLGITLFLSLMERANNILLYIKNVDACFKDLEYSFFKFQRKLQLKVQKDQTHRTRIME